MKKINFEFIFPFLGLLGLIFAFSTSIFTIPPLGPFLDPFIGAVQNERFDNDLIKQISLNSPVFKKPVSVFFDPRRVPHIYARNKEDMYCAQGYVTAYFRLWQMDFLSYASAGRLSEIFNDEYLEYDRNQRRIGILKAAEESLILMEKDTETNMILTAYTKGVNSYIHQLNYRTYPLEYKLLNYEPEEWSKLKTVLIMKYMANMLSGYEDDVNMTNLMLTLGEGRFNKYFPNMNGRSSLIKNFRTKTNTSLDFIHCPKYLDFSFLNSNTIIPEKEYNPKLGSNSWVVSGKKTKSGYPILCSDPHLGLSLPSVWLEMQLSAPQINVYGVSIPGTPAIIIGFNENVAWGITNGEDDVKDWYKLKIAGDYKMYELDGIWKKISFRVDRIKRRGQVTFQDTIYSTIHGPIVYDQRFQGSSPELKNYALKWELHRPSNDILTFIKLASAKNYADYKRALSTYSCPIQNFTFACNDNSIAVTHQGKIPVKYPGQGMFVMDGTKGDQIPARYIPEDSLPQVVNPKSNFIVSANQPPTDDHFGYFYNGYFAQTRAIQIEKMLASEKDLDVGKMEAIQLNNIDSFVGESLPVLLKSIVKNRLTAKEKGMVERLRTWDGSFDINEENPSLYWLWWKHISEYTWDEFREFSFNSKTPDNYVLLQMIKDEPDNPYFDRVGTTVKENADMIIYQAFLAASEEFNKYRDLGDIRWGSHNKVKLMHPLKIDQFSITHLRSAGVPEAINAMSSDWGPSWRMIVEVGKKVSAVGIYPGGQSGNVGDSHYDDSIDDWNKGIYYHLNFFGSEEEARKITKIHWKITN